jgi:hypothetical protein
LSPEPIDIIGNNVLDRPDRFKKTCQVLIRIISNVFVTELMRQ